jgi:hypothetical protein
LLHVPLQQASPGLPQFPPASYADVVSHDEDDVPVIDWVVVPDVQVMVQLDPLPPL